MVTIVPFLTSVGLRLTLQMRIFGHEVSFPTILLVIPDRERASTYPVNIGAISGVLRDCYEACKRVALQKYLWKLKVNLICAQTYRQTEAKEFFSYRDSVGSALLKKQ